MIPVGGEGGTPSGDGPQPGNAPVPATTKRVMSCPDPTNALTLRLVWVAEAVIPGP